MDLVHSRDIYFIAVDLMKLLDPKVMNHGRRTAYILYRMLQSTGKYEMFELAEFAFLATFHDIGAYKTDYLSDQLRYESRDCMPHSIYGYLFFLYLTPFEDRAKIILYHHTDFNKVPKSDYEFNDVIHCLNVAEKMDIYSNALGSKFDYRMFHKQAGTKYSPKALDILYQVEKEYDIFSKLSSGEYEKELDELMEYLIFTNEEKERNLFGLMTSISFRSSYTMTDNVTCVHICEELGKRLLLLPREIELLKYAALLHDAGMCSVPKEIIEAPRKLTDEEVQKLRTHVEVIEKILKDRIDPKCLEIISAHHERGDGSGYPRRLKSSDTNRLQRILQVADTVTGLTSKRSYRTAKTKEQVIDILKADADRGKFSKEIVNLFITFYDKIMDGVQAESEKTLATYKKLEDNYELTLKRIKQ